MGGRENFANEDAAQYSKQQEAQNKWPVSEEKIVLNSGESKQWIYAQLRLLTWVT